MKKEKDKMVVPWTKLIGLYKWYWKMMIPIVIIVLIIMIAMVLFVFTRMA